VVGASEFEGLAGSELVYSLLGVRLDPRTWMLKVDIRELARRARICFAIIALETI
jgi:hypothetical protein